MTKPTTTLLEEWMRLTELEYQCIASKEWNELNDLLDKKDRIKSLLSDYDSEEYSPSDRTLLDELVCRTKRNQELLESAMEEVRHLIGTQDKSLKNIQNVNQAMGQNLLIILAFILLVNHRHLSENSQFFIIFCLKSKKLMARVPLYWS